MSRRVLIAEFSSADAVLEAAAEIAKVGVPVADVYSPYPIHGIEKAIGIRRTRLGIVCFVCGALGAIAGMGFQLWALGVDWPTNIGGRPLFAWPAYVPITFEVMTLSAGLGVVAALLIRCRLFPGKKVTHLAPGISNDRFVLVVEERGPSLNIARAVEALGACNPDRVEEREI